MAPKDKAVPSNGPMPASLVLIAIILLSAALYFASSVFAPLAFALFSRYRPAAPGGAGETSA